MLKRWICGWLGHPLSRKWANYNDDHDGLTCWCGEHYTIGWCGRPHREMWESRRPAATEEGQG